MSDEHHRRSPQIRIDPRISGQLQVSIWGAVFLVLGLIIPHYDRYPGAITLPIGLVFDTVGIVLVVMALVRGSRLVRDGVFVTFAWVTMAFAVVAPLVALALTINLR